MFVDLGTLTWDTCASPTTDIGIDTRPNTTGGDKFLSSTDSRVRKTVK